MADNTGSLSMRLPSVKVSGMFKQRPNFTVFHLNSAELNRKIAFNIEKKYNQIKPPTNILQNYISHISSAIISSVAALESKINEYIVDNEDKIKKKSLDLDDNFYCQFRIKKNRKKGKNILSQIKSITSAIVKYKIINQIIHKDTKIEPNIEEKIKLIIRIRNALIHFTPEWDNDLDMHKKIEKAVENHFRLCPFYSKETMFFPYRCLSDSCAEWAITTSKDFIENFQRLISSNNEN